MTLPDTLTQTAVYDGDGRRIQSVDQANITNVFTYDGVGRLIAVTNAFGTAQSTWAQFQYDQAGNETAQIDALNRTTSFLYDAMGRRIKRTLPGLQSEAFRYDAMGNIVYHTNFNGQVITNIYDKLNRLVARTYPDGTGYTNSFSATGRRLTMNDSSGLYAYQYDVRDRLLTNTQPAGTLSYAYDANGNETNITSSTGGTAIGYQYDALNRLTNVVDSLLQGTRNTGYAFDLAGNLQSTRWPNSATNLYQYDPLNRLTNLLCKIGTNINGSFYYQFGAAGNRTNMTELLNGTPRTYTWQYDALYRLTNEAISGSGNLGYGLDTVGNRLSRTGSMGSLGPQNFSYNTNDWMTSTDVYDNDGNTTQHNGWQYWYDFEDRLVSASNSANTVAITYNADGQQIKKVSNGTTTKYLVDTVNLTGYPRVVEEQNSSGGVTCAYTYGLSLISLRQPAGTNFAGIDGHGSVRFLMNGAGTITDWYLYDAYGTLFSFSGTTVNNYLYCAEQHDPVLGLYYLISRYLNTGTGRFFTMDTYEGSRQDPLSLHKYLYCEGNPVNATDPTGLAMTWKSYMGYAAEEAIQDEYKETHPGDVVQYGGEQPAGTSFLKPDIFNTSKRTFLEIKPISYSGIMKGLAKMGIDEGAFGPLTLKYGPEVSWKPRSCLLKTSDGEIIFVINVSGLVLYKDIDEIKWELIAVGSIKVAKDLLPYLTRLSASELAPVVGRMTVGIGTAETAELGEYWGVASENALLGGVAP